MKEQSETTQKRLRLDLIVIATIVTVTLILLLVSLLSKKPGSVAVVEINGQTAGEYALTENGVFVLNGGTNTLVIENGEAYLINSHCPDHTCEKTGKIHYVGQTIVCLPNRLSVTVKGESEGGVDLVS